jgi:hypothetical protein
MGARLSSKVLAPTQTMDDKTLLQTNCGQYRYVYAHNFSLKIFRILHPWYIPRISHISYVWCDHPIPFLPPPHLANPLADRIRLDDADCDRLIF